MADALDMPNEIKVEDNRATEQRIPALCMLLRRLSYPTRLADVEMQFGWEKTRFSQITRATAMFIYQRWKHLLRFDSTRLTPLKLKEYASIVNRKGCPLNVVAAFIDGTLRRVSQPVRNQRLVYNGWKRVHCIKFHSLIAPDGLHIHVFGPVEGRRHDETLYKESGLEHLLEKYFWDPNGEPLYVYGDPAYGMGAHLLSPYKGPSISEDQQQWNAAMSRVREAVEWGFKEVSQQFAFLDFKSNQKILLQPCALFYLIAILFCNAHTILHIPQIPQYFACQPPTLSEYFQGGPVDDEELDSWITMSAAGEMEVEDEDNEALVQ